MNNPTLIKTLTAGGAVAARRLVKFGSADGAVVQAAAATDGVIGVSEAIGAASGERVDVVFAGVAEVEYGGTVTRGALLTSDASGKAIAAAPAAAAAARVIGIAMVSGVSGDIGSVLIAPGEIRAAAA